MIWKKGREVHTITRKGEVSSFHQEGSNVFCCQGVRGGFVQLWEKRQVVLPPFPFVWDNIPMLVSVHGLYDYKEP